MEEVLVSICCITYNHELYIRDALNGFLSQKTNFRYEIVIHDDASTDKTAEIIREYEKKYPELIRAIYQKENQYSKNQPNKQWLHDIEEQNCRGKYIAVCEGDDYWIDAQKLQLQVDYLEGHPECVMTAHNVFCMNCGENDKLTPINFGVKDHLIEAEEAITEKIILQTASRVYRKAATKMEDFFLKVGIRDYPYLLNFLTKGEIYYFNRIMSVYRFAHNGSWSESMKNFKYNFFHRIWVIDFLKKYNKFTYGKYERACTSMIQAQVDIALYGWENKHRGQSFVEFCRKCSTEFEGKYDETFDQLVKVWKQIFDINYLNESLYRFVSRYKNIFIMGAGKYAGIIAQRLEYHGLPFEGFVISNNQPAKKTYLGKPVLKFREFFFDIEDIGIIIGINPVLWQEIESTLIEEKISNYICPFLLEGD